MLFAVLLAAVAAADETCRDACLVRGFFYAKPVSSIKLPKTKADYSFNGMNIKLSSYALSEKRQSC